MSQFEATILQVKVGIVCNKFTVTPNFKDSSLGPPLGLDSCHPRSVLWSWPVSVIRGYGSISSSIEIARTARDLFIDRLRCYHVPTAYLQLVQTIEPCKAIRSSAVQGRPVKWIILPFHPVWSHARLQSVLHKTLHECSYMHVQAFGHACPDFRIAWHNKLPFAQRVLRCNRSDSFLTQGESVSLFAPSQRGQSDLLMV
jgi:hypothetical protein